jgi:hypothetical protein
MLHEEVVSRPRAQNSTEGLHPRAGAVFAVPGVSHAVEALKVLYAEGLVFVLPNRDSRAAVGRFVLRCVRPAQPEAAW